MFQLLKVWKSNFSAFFERFFPSIKFYVDKFFFNTLKRLFPSLFVCLVSSDKCVVISIFVSLCFCLWMLLISLSQILDPFHYNVPWCTFHNISLLFGFLELYVYSFIIFIFPAILFLKCAPSPMTRHCRMLRNHTI